MAQKLFSQVVNTRTLIRVAFAVLSLAGVAQAQSVNRTGAASTANAHPAPILQGYDVMQNGGG
jgi:hypothetical protein